MRLSRKLWLFIVLTLIIPMLIIALYAALLVRVNTEMSQWRYLETVFNQIEGDIVSTEQRYLDESVAISDMEYIIIKLYVYSKYWEKLSPSIREFDIVPLEDFLKQISLRPDLENLAVYRKSKDSFIKIISFGRSPYIPETVFEKLQNEEFNIPLYFRYSDGIYLQVLRKVYSDGKPVGALLLQKGYTASYFSGYATKFNINIALISKNAMLYNSMPAANEQLLSSLSEEKEMKHKLSVDSAVYFAYSKEFVLNNGVSGTLLLFTNSDDVIDASAAIVRNILIITIGCILIPVITFLLWGSRLVASINSLVKATTRVSSGDLEYQVATRRNDEFGLLSSNFNDMVIALNNNRSILESRNVELELKNSYIDAVFQSLLINIIVLDDQLCIRVVSSNAESKLDLPEKPVGRKLFEIPPFNENTSFLKNNIESAWSDGFINHLPSVMLGPVNYEIYLYPVKNEDKEVKTIVLVLINISEQIKMERALIRSEKLASVGQLAAGIAHEINNPMSVIMNHIQLIQSGKLNEEDENRFMTRISSEIKRVNGLIERLLQFSREENDETELISPVPVITDILNLFAPKKQEDIDGGNPCVLKENLFNVGRWIVHYKDRIINVCLADSGLDNPIRCSADSLRQVFFNIFKNALQAIHHDFGMIYIHVSGSVNKTDIRVMDNGDGIEKENIDKIFDPFFSFQRESGTGLGLSLCQTIMERVGGNISAECNQKRGTVITVSIPGEEKAIG